MLCWIDRFEKEIINSLCVLSYYSSHSCSGFTCWGVMGEKSGEAPIVHNCWFKFPKLENVKCLWHYFLRCFCQAAQLHQISKSPLVHITYSALAHAEIENIMGGRISFCTNQYVVSIHSHSQKWMRLHTPSILVMIRFLENPSHLFVHVNITAHCGLTGSQPMVWKCCIGQEEKRVLVLFSRKSETIPLNQKVNPA